MNKRRALTITDVVAIVLIVLLIFTFFAAYFRWRNGGHGARSTSCASNLADIGRGLATYAQASNNCYPIPVHVPPDQDEVGRVTYAPGKIGLNRSGRGGASTQPAEQVSTTRMLWALVRIKAMTRERFICPGSRDERNDDVIPEESWDFRSYNEVSYGCQVPFGKWARPGPEMVSTVVVVADKGPYGAAIEAGKPHPGVPKPAGKDPPLDWRPWNSPNHSGEGQNVLYKDGAAVFAAKPLVGRKKDNIYTRWSQADAWTDDIELARVHGIPPTGIETPWGDTDSLIYP